MIPNNYIDNHTTQPATGLRLAPVDEQGLRQGYGHTETDQPPPTPVGG